MRKKKKIELAEALATLCRDSGYKKVTAETFDDEEFSKKVVDLINHTLDFDSIAEIHERFFQIVLQDKKINKLLENSVFKETFDEQVKGISKYKKAQDKDLGGVFHLNNYFGLDTEKIFLHYANSETPLSCFDNKHHKITSQGDPYYVNSKKGSVLDESGNEMVRVLFKSKGFVFKHNHLPFAVEYNQDSGLIYMMSNEYRDSVASFEDIDVDKCLAFVAMDCVSEDYSYTYAVICNTKVNNEHLPLIIYITMAAMCAIANALGRSSSSSTLTSLLLLNIVLRNMRIH